MADDPTPDPKPTDSGERLDPVRLIAENGTAEAAVRTLAYKLNDVERDNAKFRERIRSLEAQVPAEGARVLSGDELAAFDAREAALADAGLETPEKIAAFVETAKANAQTVADLARAKEFKAVAEVTGTNAQALVDVFRDGEAFEIQGEGESRKVLVRPRADAEPVEFATYVDEHKAALKPALYAGSEPQPAPPQLSFPSQRAGGRPPQPQTFDADAAAAQKRRSPSYAASF